MLKAAKKPVDLCRPRLAQPRRMERARRARRGARRARRHRPQDRRRVPDRPSALRRRAARRSTPDCVEGLTRPMCCSASTGSTSPARCAAAPRPVQQIIHVSLDQHLHNGWSMDYQALPPVDLLIAADPDAVVSQLLDGARRRRQAEIRSRATSRPSRSSSPTTRSPTSTSPTRCAGGRRAATSRLTHLPLSWDADWWPFRHPLDSGRRRRRRRRRRRPRHVGRRGARAQGHRPHCRSASAATATT